MKKHLQGLHDRLLPPEKFHVHAVPLEHGGYPPELYGGTGALQRRRRRSLETVLGTLVGLAGTTIWVDQVETASGWWVIAALGTLLPLLGRAVWELQHPDAATIRRLSLKAAEKDPQGLHLAWMSCWELQVPIEAAYRDAMRALPEAEAEVATALADEYPGSIRELCEVAEELCRQDTPTG